MAERIHPIILIIPSSFLFVEVAEFAVRVEFDLSAGLVVSVVVDFWEELLEPELWLV